MLTANDYEVMKLRNAELQREAETDRLAHEGKEIPAHKVVMAKVGKALVAIGSQLEAQGGVVVNVHGTGEIITP